MHYWGDGFLYFYQVGESAEYIGYFCRRWGRLNVTSMKEKYGTVRVYCSFGYLSLHILLYPGYVFKRPYWPNWLWKLDVYYISKVFNFFQPLIFIWQKFIYRLAYKKALKKWPMIRKEILACSDYPEFLENL